MYAIAVPIYMAERYIEGKQATLELTLLFLLASLNHSPHSGPDKQVDISCPNEVTIRATTKSPVRLVHVKPKPRSHDPEFPTNMHASM